MTNQNGAEAPAAADDNHDAQVVISYGLRVFARSPEGFVVEVVADETERPLDWLAKTTRGLKAQKFEPVDPFPGNVINVTAPEGGRQDDGRGQGTAGEATWIQGEGGKPPRCSIHGPGKWVEGTYAQGKPKAGQHYEFWSCTVQGCRPKGRAAG